MYPHNSSDTQIVRPMPEGKGRCYTRFKTQVDAEGKCMAVPPYWPVVHDTCDIEATTVVSSSTRAPTDTFKELTKKKMPSKDTQRLLSASMPNPADVAKVDGDLPTFRSLADIVHTMTFGLNTPVCSANVEVRSKCT